MVEPVETSPPVVEPDPVVEPVETRPKRRFGWLIALAIIAVLVAGFFAADAVVRQVATGYVHDRVVEALRLDPATPVDVDLGAGSVILQAASGSLDEITVHADEIAFGELTGEAQLVATDVPLDRTRPIGTLAITVTVTEENVRKLASFVSASELKSIDLRDGVVRIGAELDVIFSVVPVSVDLVPSAVEGRISFDPTTVVIGGEEISVHTMGESGAFAGIAGVLDSLDFCVASSLPQALSVADADVVGTDLVIVIEGDGTALADPALTTLGSCPEGR